MFHDRTCGRAISLRLARAIVSASVVVACTLSSASYGATVIHVDDDAPANGDGTSWASAYRFLQDALYAAEFSGDACEIRIAGGQYRPDRSEAAPAGTGDRAATFGLLDDVVLRGGYAGVGAPMPDLHDPVAHPATLSGDLAGDDAPEFGNNGENAWQVLTAPIGVNATARLEWLVITGANAEGPTTATQYGGGLRVNINASPFIADCTFIGNRALARGGGVYVTSSSAKTTLLRCRFIGNTAEHGGGLWTESADPTVTCCQFLGNTATSGGAMGVFNGADPTLTNCLIAGNTAERGGAMWNLINANLKAINCTIVGNTASIEGGGLYGNSGSDPRFHNCILWGNADAGGMDASAQITHGTGDPAVNYSTVQGGWTGDGGNNIAVDPEFADADGPDDDPATLHDNDYRLAAGSPCIDAGRNFAVSPDVTDEDNDADMTELIPFDLDGAPRFTNDPAAEDTGCGGEFFVDIGAFESDGPALDPVRIGDLDENGRVGFSDLLALLGQWGPCPVGCCTGNLDNGAGVSFADVLILIANWN